jgi:hypothetical protein
MAPRPEPRHTIPTGEHPTFRRLHRRTLVVRAALALALLATLALAFLFARDEGVQHAPLVPSGTTGMLVLDLSASVYEGAFGQTIQQLADADEEVGVVAFSDAAYELVPPGTPGRELLPLLRYFSPTSSSGSLPRNPWEQFRAGTRISEGLTVAREVLLERGASDGSIVLVSDLEILPDEIIRLADVAALLRGDGIELRIVPLFLTPEKQTRIDAILGSSRILRESSEAAPVRAPEARSLEAAAPWAFLLVGALLVGLLAANEGLLSRLEVGR